MLLSIQDLKVGFRMGKVDGVAQRADAVKGVSFDIPENSIVALVGESGSGKSVTAMSILNLLPDNAGNPVVLELELTEPSMFLALAPGAVERFAAAIARRVGA